MEKNQGIFAKTSCISAGMLTKYISDKLSPAEKHEVEMHLIDCDLCSDAAEGLGMIADKKRFSEITAGLNKKITDGLQKKEVKIIFLRRVSTPIAIAASLIVVLGAIWYFSNYTLDTASSEKIFADKFEPYQSKEEPGNTAATKTEALHKSTGGTPAESLKEPARMTGSMRGNEKKAYNKEAEVAMNFSQSETKTEDKKYKEAGDKMKVEVSSSAEPKPAIEVESELLASDKQSSKPIRQAAQEPAPPSAIALKSSGKILLAAQQENRSLPEQKQPSGEIMTLETKPRSEKERAEAKKLNKTQAPQPAVNSASVADADIHAESNTNTRSMFADSVAEGRMHISNAIDIAMKKYEQKDYSGAAEDFEKILTRDPDNYNVLFYLSVSYLGTGQGDKAVVNLSKIIKKESGRFYNDAQWYLSLAYIKMNDTQNARKILTEVQKNSKSQYQKQASETLKEMNK